MNLVIDSKILIAAMACQATKGYREYLKGIFIGTDGWIAGTNGHVLFATKIDEKDVKFKEDIVIKIHGKIPKNAINSTLEVIDGHQYGVLHCSDEHQQTKKVLAFEIIREGKYPDIKKFTTKESLKAVKEVAINPSYLALPAKVFGGAYCNMQFNGDDKPIKFYPESGDWPEETVFLVLPLRPKVKEES